MRRRLKTTTGGISVHTVALTAHLGYSEVRNIELSGGIGVTKSYEDCRRRAGREWVTASVIAGSMVADLSECRRAQVAKRDIRVKLFTWCVEPRQ